MNALETLGHVYNYVYMQPASWVEAGGMTIHAVPSTASMRSVSSEGRTFTLTRYRSYDDRVVIWQMKFGMVSPNFAPGQAMQSIYIPSPYETKKNPTINGVVALRGFVGDRDQYHKDLVLIRMFEGVNDFDVG